MLPGVYKNALEEAAAIDGVESLEVSRLVFEARMQNVGFASWDDFVSCASGRPAKTEEASHCGLVTVLSVGGALSVSACSWGLIGLMFSYPAAAIALDIAYGIVSWLLVKCVTSPALTQAIWPNLPLAVAAPGGLVARFAGSVRSQAIWLLLLCVLPQMLAAVCWLQGLPHEPARASLFLNVFVGTWAAFVVALRIFAAGDVVLAASPLLLLLLGLASVMIAARLSFNSSKGSAELITWAVNVGALAIFAALHVILQVPQAGTILGWILYILMAAALGLLGAVFNHSLPSALGALCCVEAALRAATEAALLAPLGVSLGQRLTLGLTVLGLLGAAGSTAVYVLARRGFWASLQEELQLGAPRAPRIALEPIALAGSRYSV